MGVPGKAVAAESAVMTDTLAFIGTWLKRGVQILGERGRVRPGRPIFGVKKHGRRRPVTRIRGSQPLHPHLNEPILGKAQGFRRGMAEVNQAALYVRSAVIDADNDALPRIKARHPRPTGQAHGAMGGLLLSLTGSFAYGHGGMDERAIGGQRSSRTGRRFGNVSFCFFAALFLALGAEPGPTKGTTFASQKINPFRLF